MTKKRSKKSRKTPKSSLKTYKEILLDYKTGKKEAKKLYLSQLKKSKFKKDKLLTTLPDFILKKDLKGGVKQLLDGIENKKIKLEKLTLAKAKTKLKKGEKLLKKGKKSKTIFVPTGFFDRDYFNQLISLQHKYKLCRYSTKTKGSKANKDILKTSLALVVLAIKATYPRHLTENFYNRYKLRLEEIKK